MVTVPDPFGAGTGADAGSAGVARARLGAVRFAVDLRLTGIVA